MEPRAFVKLSVAALALRIPEPASSSTPGGPEVHATPPPCSSQIRLPGFPPQTAAVPLVSPTKPSAPTPLTLAASFYLDEPVLKKLQRGTLFGLSSRCLEVAVYAGWQGSSCGLRTGKMLGKFAIPVGTDWAAASKPHQLHNGWVCIGKPRAQRPPAQLHLIVKIESDPRYFFQFGAEPELSPQIVQVQGSIRQPIFSCKFTQDRSSRSRFGSFDSSSGGGWSLYQGEKDKERKERKGWLIIIHDLSGSPVAAASIITPFVPSAGSDFVTHSNPGAWLILKPGPQEDNWRPWGRLEAWRERGNRGMGCRFQLADETVGVSGMTSDILLSECVIDTQKGGMFTIDTAKLKHDTPVPCSPVESPRSSGDFYFSLATPFVGGFVMSTSIQGEGKCSKPQVQLAVRHVTCMEDAALYMALAAALNLSMDACLPFTRKLGKGFSPSDNSD